MRRQELLAKRHVEARQDQVAAARGVRGRSRPKQRGLQHPTLRPPRLPFQSRAVCARTSAARGVDFDQGGWCGRRSDSRACESGAQSARDGAGWPRECGGGGRRRRGGAGEATLRSSTGWRLACTPCCDRESHSVLVACENRGTGKAVGTATPEPSLSPPAAQACVRLLDAQARKA